LSYPSKHDYRIDADHNEIRWSLREARAREIGELLYRQEGISGAVFDAFDHESPEHFARRGAVLADLMHAASITV
jgi:hypothetical protein